MYPTSQSNTQRLMNNIELDVNVYKNIKNVMYMKYKISEENCSIIGFSTAIKGPGIFKLPSTNRNEEWSKKMA